MSRRTRHDSDSESDSGSNSNRLGEPRRRHDSDEEDTTNRGSGRVKLDAYRDSRDTYSSDQRPTSATRRRRHDSEDRVRPRSRSRSRSRSNSRSRSPIHARSQSPTRTARVGKESRDASRSSYGRDRPVSPGHETKAPPSGLRAASTTSFSRPRRRSTSSETSDHDTSDSDSSEADADHSTKSAEPALPTGVLSGAEYALYAKNLRERRERELQAVLKEQGIDVEQEGSGNSASRAVFRDRETGRRLTAEEVETLRLAAEKRQQSKRRTDDQTSLTWGSGLTQRVAGASALLAALEARGLGDEQLRADLRELQRAQGGGYVGGSGTVDAEVDAQLVWDDPLEEMRRERERRKAARRAEKAAKKESKKTDRIVRKLAKAREKGEDAYKRLLEKYEARERKRKEREEEEKQKAQEAEADRRKAEQEEEMRLRKQGIVVRKPRPYYTGTSFANRFGIKSGYRWDGIDRSNGWENKIIQYRAQQQAKEAAAYRANSRAL